MEGKWRDACATCFVLVGLGSKGYQQANSSDSCLEQNTPFKDRGRVITAGSSLTSESVRVGVDPSLAETVLLGLRAWQVRIASALVALSVQRFEGSP